DGPNIPLQLPAAGPVKFYYDHKSHWVTSNRNSVIATVPGDFQSKITGGAACPGDWDPTCLRTWLQDVDGDGVYTLTVHLPPGSYQAKVAINESWAENYGANGQRDGSNLTFTVPPLPATGKDVTFLYNATSHVTTIVVGGIKGDLSLAKAHWLNRDTIAWNVAVPAAVTQLTARLHSDPALGLELSPNGVTGGTSLTLTQDAAGLSPAQKARFPHLASAKVFKLAGDVSTEALTTMLQGQLAIDLVDQNGEIIDATSLQLPGVLDALFTYTGELGPTWSGIQPTLRLWAPTARSVKLRRYNTSDAGDAGIAPVAMTKLNDAAGNWTGVWTITGIPSWKNTFYLYEVETWFRQQNQVQTHLVTDPYSISLSTNSKRSQLVDFNDAALKPDGWDTLAKPAFSVPEDSVVYELHVRDFSITDYTVPEGHRGTFMAFTHAGANGMQHLGGLRRAGLTHVHLLPAFDFATVEENPAARQEPRGDLSAFAPDSTKQREAVNAVRDQDAFNWGYDPYHYNVPEGSYSVDPNGSFRIREFREMVKALNRTGLRVVMDVVYNHTTASGTSEKSVLDKVVPGYYHRLNPDGNVETSTCCQNTATEHAMMEKLMVDSVKLWATAYKVDGFRFDLMGHHMKSNMVKVRVALDAITPAAGGVDGSKVYVYGEGWNFGEVANNARGVNATQLNMAGTGIGSFTDRLRDAARGGSPFAPKTEQGFISGLGFAPNGTDQGSESDLQGRLRHQQDLIRLGLAGNLKDYTVPTTDGRYLRGSQLDYNGQPAGYAADPQETINYVSAHDNDTLFDALQAKLPVATPMADRVRANNLGVSLVMLAQGIPFFHAGDEIIRSKSGDHNSYNSGDWFNRLDWTYESNNWGVGLPPHGDDAVLKPLLANPALKPAKKDITRALDHFVEMLQIRKSSRLFRLQTADEVNKVVYFHNTGANAVPGLVVMQLYNIPKFENEYERVVVVFNASPNEAKYGDTLFRGIGFALHPVLQTSTDTVVKGASFDPTTGSFKIPGRTTAVFVSKVAGTGTGGGGCACGTTNGVGFGAISLLMLAGLMVMRRRAVR
ncbi:MAG TPA: pullulanase-type alpha-1,6-glucosidase, partial [Myxococcaceae bacterium]|nr:pullulanase-type alpha-1,6-glucosidase [Myxococcaceae bacterium]